MHELNYDFLRRVHKIRRPLPDHNVQQGTHTFKIEAPLLAKGKVLCITGSSKIFGRWNAAKAPRFSIDPGRESSLVLDLTKERFPLEYKLAVYDKKSRQIVAYEEGPNRVIDGAEATAIHFGFPFSQFAWKAAGVNIQLSALKRAGGWGIGDFTDLEELIRWSAKAGFRLIQLLPLNDTTAVFGDRDSYPYSPVSSKALHPQFLDAGRLAARYGFAISDDDFRNASQLNELTFEDQPGVMQHKFKVLQEIFDFAKEDFCEDKNWLEFSEVHRSWLKPYAVWCALRDKHRSANPADWGALTIYEEAAVDEFAAPGSPHYDDVLFHYFLQYHLHRSLQRAADLAHRKKILLKADLPIGMNLHSADVWQYPQFFNTDMQAGAPPDYFTKNGQNWGFPTYNWKNIEADGFKWFRERLQHPQKYFDAIRIDHVLGLFRIWSIPRPEILGSAGSFPTPEDTWEAEGRKKLLMMKESTSMLLCAEDLGLVPDFLESVLRELHILSLEIQQMGKIDNTALADVNRSPYEAVVMPGTHDMPTLREWWELDKAKSQIFFNSVLKEPGEAPAFLEPLLAKKIIDLHLETNAMFSIFLLQDILAMNGKLRRADPAEERINDPANDLHVWRWRMHIETAALYADKGFRKELKKMIKVANRL